MKIGYLHFGITQSGESGLTRYSRIIATEVKRRSELIVIEAEVILAEDDKPL